jgi:hypothetical protein
LPEVNGFIYDSSFWGGVRFSQYLWFGFRLKSGFLEIDQYFVILDSDELQLDGVPEILIVSARSSNFRVRLMMFFLASVEFLGEAELGDLEIRVLRF